MVGEGSTAAEEANGAPRASGPDQAQRTNAGPEGTPEMQAAGHIQGRRSGPKTNITPRNRIHEKKCRAGKDAGYTEETQRTHKSATGRSRKHKVRTHRGQEAKDTANATNQGPTPVNKHNEARDTAHTTHQLCTPVDKRQVARYTAHTTNQARTPVNKRQVVKDTAHTTQQVRTRVKMYCACA